VQKSQDLLNIALDIAAARGKPLSTVVEALGKAATGTTGGLGRLGLATKDAGGEALTFDQILKNASQTMGGAAAAAANTTSGRMAILKARFADLQEEIGARVLPILNRFLGWILDKGIPALRDLSGWFNEHVTPALRRLGTYINDKLVPAFQTMINDIWPTVQKNLQAMADDARSLASAFNHLSGKTNSTSDTVNILGLALKALSTIAAGVFDDIAQSVRWILFPIQKVNEALQAMIAWIRSIPDAIAGLKSAFNGIPDAIKNRIPGLAVGTRNFSGGLAVVGERGPELVSLPRGANVYTASETRRMTRTPSAAPGVDSGGIAAAVATAMASLSWRVDLDPSGVARIVAVGNKQIARRG
jgi:phage-related protein